MDENKFIEVEGRLRDAVSTARAEGYKVEPGTWGITQENPEDGKGYVWRPRGGDSCLCPMGCVIVGERALNGHWDPEGTASEKLGISAREVSNFIVGFDGAEMDTQDYEEDEMYYLGRSLRKEAIK